MYIKAEILDFINRNSKNEYDSFYVYDSQKIREHCRAFKSITYKNKSIHFASMANVNPQFLNIVKEEYLNIFVNSVMHMEMAYKSGFRADEIIFTSSALSCEVMKKAESYGVQINADSPNQLMQWMKLFPDKPIGIRCNIGDAVKPYSNHAGSFIGNNSRLGFTIREIRDIPDKSKVKGFHLYVGTDIFDINYFIDCYKELIALTEDFPELEYLNFGGGFGVSENGDEKFDFGQYNTRVSELMQDISHKKGKSIKLILEPGRIIGGEAGYFVCYVSDIKDRKEMQFVGVNASTVQFSRPLLYADIADHPVMVIRGGTPIQTDDKRATTIYGCSTYSRDIFSNNIELPELQTGDTIVFGNAGSYCASSYMQFLGFRKPEEFFV
ncbi:hypothetical protein ACE1ET_16260 [Saccharicrinis sp. FJH62]|uniref:hypothetical protein n=1 Tax=Saccharicrinis sp. FJH62 TaxID=3344657 RepID=UPI0035D40CC2